MLLCSFHSPSIPSRNPLLGMRESPLDVRALFTILVCHARHYFNINHLTPRLSPTGTAVRVWDPELRGVDKSCAGQAVDRKSDDARRPAAPASAAKPSARPAVKEGQRAPEPRRRRLGGAAPTPGRSHGLDGVARSPGARHAAPRPLRRKGIAVPHGVLPRFGR